MLWGGLCFFMMALSFLSLTMSNTIWLVEWSLLFYCFSFSVVFIFDFFSFFFSSVVLIISSGIFIFGQYYMDSDYKQKGFCILLSMFVFSMMVLIFSSSMFSLLLGWDGLGLTSYLLVIYYMNYSSSAAGMLTFLVNRLGDMFFLLGISLFFYFGTWSFTDIKYYPWFLSLVIFFTAITKSAQIPFSSWLPAAMAAPTPVSSLVHSSTLVTAGIFLLLRFNGVVFIISNLLLVLSLMTMLMAGICANFEWDMKKMIAFSTLSQLGFMMFSLSQGMIFFCFFHLLCHALFKAALFMISGVMIHNMDSFQDFRSSFSFFSTSSLSTGVIVCVLCLCGFPFLSGFFSKDFILDAVTFNFFFFSIFFFSVLLTISYSLRFSYYSLMSLFLKHSKVMMFYDSVKMVVFSVWILIIYAVFLGLFWMDLISFFFVNMSFFSELWKTSYLFLLSILVIILMLLLHMFTKSVKLQMFFFSSMFFLSSIFKGRLFLKLLKSIGNHDKVASQGWSEMMGPQFFFLFFHKVSFFLLRVEAFMFLVFLLFFYMVVVMLL